MLHFELLHWAFIGKEDINPPNLRIGMEDILIALPAVSIVEGMILQHPVI